MPIEPLASGTRLHRTRIRPDGCYVVRRQIGSGGFGVAYLADDLANARLVVIKEFAIESVCHRRPARR